jgi:excisionase family DNA binding protein
VAKIGDIEQASAATGLSVSWFRKQIMGKKIPHLKVGRRVLFDLDLLVELLNERYRVEARPEVERIA